MIKNTKYVGIVLLTIFSSVVYAQRNKCCQLGYVYKTSFNYQPPRFLDAELFKNDLRSKLDLQDFLIALRKNSEVGYYLYSFSVGKSGKIRPIIYYDRKNVIFKKMQSFVTTSFNRYKWAPAYKKNCIKCKAKAIMELSISFEDEIDKVIIEMEYLENHSKKKVFLFTIPYTELKQLK